MQAELTTCCSTASGSTRTPTPRVSFATSSAARSRRRCHSTTTGAEPLGVADVTRWLLGGIWRCRRRGPVGWKVSWLLALGIVALGVYTVYRLILARRPEAVADRRRLGSPSVLKALYLQQHFTRFVIDPQGPTTRLSTRLRRLPARSSRASSQAADPGPGCNPHAPARRSTGMIGLDLADIQGNIHRPLWPVTVSRTPAICFSISAEPAQAGHARFVDRCPPAVTTAERMGEEKGVRRAGRRTSRQSRSTSASPGMASAHSACRTRTLRRCPTSSSTGWLPRNEILGDVGDSAPEKWDPIWCVQQSARTRRSMSGSR